MKLCSACLLGVKCRFDGGDKSNEKVMNLSRDEPFIPVCPEQLGGLTTPRTPSEIRGDKVVTHLEEDVTVHFHKGAEEVLRIAKHYGITEAIMKQKSAACGCGKVFDGTFSGKIIKGDGITTALLKKNGINVISEEEL